MKKIVLIFLISLQLFSYDDYIGLGVGASKFTVNTPIGDVDNQGTSLTLDLGHKYGERGRFHLVATYVIHDDEILSAGSYSAGYDILVPFFNDRLELYVGPVLGYTSYEEKDFTLSGLHYGGEVGLLVKVSKHIELEAGYNFLSQTQSTELYTAKNTQTAYFQVNFFFNKEKYFKYE